MFVIFYEEDEKVRKKPLEIYVNNVQLCDIDKEKRKKLLGVCQTQIKQIFMATIFFIRKIFFQ